MKGYSVRAPSLARTVFAHVPHHITQRGDRHEEIFFSDEDRETYRAWLQDYSQRHDVAILAYWLMSNHIHLPAAPGTEEALQAVLKPLHMGYAQRLKRQRGWKGHVRQGRYFSSPLHQAYLWARRAQSGAGTNTQEGAELALVRCTGAL